MPVPDGVITHGEDIHIGINSSNQPRLDGQETIGILQLPRQGEIENAGSDIQIVYRQVTELLTLNRLFKVLLVRPTSAEGTKP